MLVDLQNSSQKFHPDTTALNNLSKRIRPVSDIEISTSCLPLEAGKTVQGYIRISSDMISWWTTLTGALSCSEIFLTIFQQQ
ncbi:MAG: hypothetical protein SWO11_04540 [Thermodesulfobacteriota bacterium]|nr:hypothetical protein [Thermodesulfobacteriota bacterium]